MPANVTLAGIFSSFYHNQLLCNSVISLIFCSFSRPFLLVIRIIKNGMIARRKNTAGIRLITAFILFNVDAAISVFGTNQTAPNAMIPIEPPIAFAILVEKPIAIPIVPSERFPVLNQLSSINSPQRETDTIVTIFVAP